MKRFKVFGVFAGLLGVAVLVHALPAYPFFHALWLGNGAKNNTEQFSIETPSAGASAVFRPGTNNANALGTSALRFSNVFTTLLNVSGAATMSGATSHTAAVTLGSASQLIFTSPAVQSVQIQSTAINPSSSYVKIGSTGTITLTGTPTISTSSATDGQYLVVDSTAAVITIQDGSALSNSALCLSAGTVAITTSTPVSFIYSSTSGCWKQIK